MLAAQPQEARLLIYSLGLFNFYQGKLGISSTGRTPQEKGTGTTAWERGPRGGSRCREGNTGRLNSLQSRRKRRKSPSVLPPHRQPQQLSRQKATAADRYRQRALERRLVMWPVCRSCSRQGTVMCPPCTSWTEQGKLQGHAADNRFCFSVIIGIY